MSYNSERYDITYFYRGQNRTGHVSVTNSNMGTRYHFSFKNNVKYKPVYLTRPYGEWYIDDVELLTRFSPRADLWFAFTKAIDEQIIKNK